MKSSTSFGNMFQKEESISKAEFNRRRIARMDFEEEASKASPFQAAEEQSQRDQARNRDALRRLAIALNASVA